MPKHPRGLLGVRKDPKNQILFSFNVREGDEWPSDDDEDDDYKPGSSDSDSEGKKAASKSPAIKHKTRLSEKPKNVKRRKLSASGENSKTTPCTSAATKDSVPMLPPEIWEKIFMMIVRKDGALPFLLNAGYVCPLWKEICDNPALWDRVDLSYGWIKFTDSRKFKGFCESKLKLCTELNVSDCKFMNNAWGVDHIANYCPNLRVLNLSQCKKLPNGSVEKLATHCENLEDIDLSSTTMESVSPHALNCLVDKIGSRLKRIVVANNMVKSVNIFLNSLTENCPNLEHLDVSNVKYHSSCLTFDIEKFQQFCPKLKTIYLANVVVRSEPPSSQIMEESPGFVHLEELSIANAGSYLRSNFIERILKNATKLRLIDLRGCIAGQVVAKLDDVQCPNIEQLYLSRSEAASCRCLGDIIQKWRHSLTHLDLSWNNYADDVLEPALLALCEGQSNLVNLDLSGTKVNMDQLKKLLRNLNKLECLDLSSCRDLDRGCKRSYKTQQEILQLRKSLNCDKWT